MLVRRVLRRRVVAGAVAAALLMTGMASPSVAGAAGSSAVDDDVTAVVNAVAGTVNVLSNDVRARSGPFNALAVVYPASATTAAGGSATCTFSSCAYTAPAGFVGQDSFTYRLTYPSTGGGNTGPTSLATVRVTVVPNAAPTAVDDVATARGPSQPELVDNDSDPNRSQVGERLAVAATGASTTAAGASVTCPAPSDQQACEYIPAAGFAGTDTFTYTVVDANGATDEGAVTVTVPPNLPPVAVDDAVERWVRHGATPMPLQVQVADNDSDPDGDSMVVQVASPTTSAGGSVSCGTACLYTPPDGFFGVDTFTYVAVDGLGATSSPATVTITVSPDDPPLAVADAAATKGTRTVQVPVLQNDSDDHGSLSLVNSWTDGGSDPASAAGGSVACLDSTCGYTPAPGFVGVDTFRYVASDGISTASGTVTVDVGANGAPVARDDTRLFRVDDGQANDGNYFVTVPVVANDTDPDGDAVSAQGAGTTAAGHDWWCDGGTCTVEVPEAWIGVDVFTYTAADGFGGTDTASVSVDADTVHTGSPEVGPDTVTTSAGVPIRVDVLANDLFWDPVDPTLTVDPGTSASTAGGTVVCSSVDCTYTPPAGFAGTDTFTYRAVTRYLNGARGTVTVAVVDPGVSGTTTDGGTFASGGAPSPGDPLTTSVVTPLGGPVRIDERATQTPAPVGYALLGQEVSLTAPEQTAAAPLQLTFQLDATLLGGTAASAVQMWRNGTLVPACVGGSTATQADPDPCVRQRAAIAGGGARITVLSSAASVWGFGRMTAVAPSAPLVPTATAGVRSISASWSPPAADGGAPISGYQLTATPVAVPAGATAVARTVTVSGPLPATTATIGSLVNGVTYVVTVRARNAVNPAYGSASVASSPVTTPATPAAPVLTSVAAGVRQVSATWQAPADGGSPVTSYRLTATPVGGGTARSVAVSAPATAGTLVSLADSTTYLVTVTATNAAGAGPASAPGGPVTTPAGVPSAPTGVVATPGIRSASVTWSAPVDDGGAPISAYRVTATPVAATVPAGVAASTRTVGLTGAPPVTGTTVTSLVNGVTYTFTVTARNAAVGTYSVPSDPVTAQVPGLPRAPVITAVAPGPVSATVAWDPPASDLPVTGYTVRATAPRAGTTPHVVSRTITGTPPGSSTTLTGMVAGLDYTVTVSAVSAVGAGPVSSPSAVVRPLVGISVNDVTRVEGNSATTSFTFTVRLSAVQTSAVTVDLATVDGTANGLDYVPSATTLTFAPGQTSRTVTVRVNGDTTVEPTETFTVVLSNASTGAFTKQVGTGTITNDDG